MLTSFCGFADSMYEKLHATCGMEFLGMGNGAWGMGHGAWGRVSNAQCPVPQVAGQLSLYRHLGMEFPAAFNENDFA
ncbi:hypothetical protein [Nostoc commune]|uniref:hypothetical protein n=1 Tax=Nostoc commune TaxID=1178 RepID=UPI0020736A0C|nr:hypothetical protein [Nostoc commune]